MEARSLCRLAHQRVDIGVKREADAFDLVPTASTSVALAVADALAVGLMAALDLGPDDFRRYHPGGAPGSRLAEDIRSRGIHPFTNAGDGRSP